MYLFCGFIDLTTYKCGAIIRVQVKYAPKKIFKGGNRYERK